MVVPADKTLEQEWLSCYINQDQEQRNRTTSMFAPEQDRKRQDILVTQILKFSTSVRFDVDSKDSITLRDKTM